MNLEANQVSPWLAGAWLDISSGVIVECLSLPLPVDAQDVLSFGDEVLGACVIDACHVNKLMLKSRQNTV